jgi:hypothetical protein
MYIYLYRQSVDIKRVYGELLVKEPIMAHPLPKIRDSG